GRVVASFRAQFDRLRRVVLLGLVGDEEMQPVADQRATEERAVLLLLRLDLRAALMFRGRARTPLGRGVVPEEDAFELVGARTRRGHDRGAADLVELGLVVGGDDLVLADRELRERVAARGVLATDAARQGVALLADAIDVDVYRPRGRRAGAQAGVAAGVLDERHAWDGGRER